MQSTPCQPIPPFEIWNLLQRPPAPPGGPSIQCFPTNIYYGGWCCPSVLYGFLWVSHCLKSISCVFCDNLSLTALKWISALKARGCGCRMRAWLHNPKRTHSLKTTPYYQGVTRSKSTKPLGEMWRNSRPPKRPLQASLHYKHQSY